MGVGESRKAYYGMASKCLPGRVNSYFTQINRYGIILVTWFTFCTLGEKLRVYLRPYTFRNQNGSQPARLDFFGYGMLYKRRHLLYTHRGGKILPGHICVFCRQRFCEQVYICFPAHDSPRM